MTRRLKFLGAIAAAIFVTAGLAAQGASAKWHSTALHTALHGVQSTALIYSASAGFPKTTCANATFAGTMATTTPTSQLLSPTYANCKDSLGRTVHIAKNGCQYGFQATSGSGSTFTGTMDIECSAGNPITTQVTTTAGTCTTTIGSQTGVGTIHYVNAGDITITFNVGNLKVGIEGPVFACGTSATTSTTGTTSGTVTIQGNSGAATISISADEPPPPPVFEVTSTYTSKSGAHGHTSFSADQTTPYAFTPAGGAPSVSCEEVSYEGTSEAGEDTAIVVSPSYVGCEDSLGRKADIETNGCLYELAPTKEVISWTFSGTADIECGAKPIEIKITSAKEEVLCTITIASQINVGPVHFTNMTAKTPTNLTIGFEATNVANTTSGGSTPCGVADGAHQGSYKGGSELDGESCVPADVAVKKE